MDDRTKAAFDFAADLVKQLITLSTGIIALTVTFAKDIFATAPGQVSNWLIAAWVMYALSIVCGIWALMALTATLDPPNPQSSETTKPTIQSSNCRIPTGFQIITFLLALTLTITYAVTA